MNQQLQDIELIKKMIGESQGSNPFNSIFFILWGITIPVATLITLIFDLNNLDRYIGYIWFITVLTSTIVSIILGKRDQTDNHKTVLSKAYSMLWIGLLISNSIVLIFLFTNILPLNFALFTTSLLLGLTCFGTGAIHREPIIKVVGLLWFVLGISILLIQESYSGYIMGFASLFLNLIPSMLIRRTNERL